MRRLTMVAVVLAVLGTACAWARPRFDAANTGNNPYETALSRANVASLAERFRLPSARPNVVPKYVVARGHAYVTGSPIQVFDAAGTNGCSGIPRTCTPHWSIGGGDDVDVFGTTLYDGGNAFDADGVQHCGGIPKVCTQLWQEGVGSAAPGPTDPVRLHLGGHTSFGHGSESASLYGYDVPCPPIPADCPLRWSAPLGSGSAGGIIGGPAVGGTRVFASYNRFGAPTGTLFAFDGTQGTAPQLWSATLPGIGSDFVAVGDGVVVTVVQAPAGSELVAYDAAGATNCSGAPVACQPLWTSDAWGAAGGDAAPAIANGFVYRAVGTQLRAYDLHGNANCSGAPKVCQKLWVGAVGSGATAPAVANGVVYVSAADGTVQAYDARGITNCSATTRVCSALWDTSLGSAAGPPEVAGGRVYVGAADGSVRVFGVH